MKSLSTSSPMEFIAPTESKLSKATIDALGSQIAAKVHYTPGGELDAIVDRLGGTIEHQPWESASDGGSLEVYPEQRTFRIRISPLAGHLRNRFTIAHELGHYFLHSDVGQKPVRVMREGTGRLEWEANWFAASFLMPAEHFRAHWKILHGRTGALVDMYKVSEPVIDIRRQYLQLG